MNYEGLEAKILEEYDANHKDVISMYVKEHGLKVDAKRFCLWASRNYNDFAAVVEKVKASVADGKFLIFRRWNNCYLYKIIGETSAYYKVVLDEDSISKGNADAVERRGDNLVVKKSERWGGPRKVYDNKDAYAALASWQTVYSNRSDAPRTSAESLYKYLDRVVDESVDDNPEKVKECIERAGALKDIASRHSSELEALLNAWEEIDR